MINVEELLLKVVAELKTGDFFEAVKNAGLNDYEVKFILDILEARGV